METQAVSLGFYRQSQTRVSVNFANVTVVWQSVDTVSRSIQKGGSSSNSSRRHIESKVLYPRRTGYLNSRWYFDPQGLPSTGICSRVCHSAGKVAAYTREPRSGLTDRGDELPAAERRREQGAEPINQFQDDSGKAEQDRQSRDRT
jgi:hypothetical protein